MATIQDDKTRVENLQSALKSVKIWGNSPSDLNFFEIIPNQSRKGKKIKIVDNLAKTTITQIIYCTIFNHSRTMCQNKSLKV